MDVTVTSRPAVSTFTDKGSVLLATASSILAGRRASAPVNWSLGRQEADDKIGSICLSKNIEVRRLKVCECVYLAAVASVAFGAGATEGLEGILTDSSIKAGLGVTLVDLILAMGASEA